jgi:hypothetical protein
VAEMLILECAVHWWRLALAASCGGLIYEAA